MPIAAQAAVYGSGHYVELCAGDDREMVVAFARLPGVRLLDRPGRRWLLPMVPRAADALRELLGRVEASPDVVSWIASVPQWAASVQVRTGDGTPFIEIRTERGHAPDDLSWLSGPVRRTPQSIEVPLSVANVRALGELPMEIAALELSDPVRRAYGWLCSHPAATFIPGAELSVYRSEPTKVLAVKTIWDPELEEAFLAQETRIMRERQLAGSGGTGVPVEAWTPEMVGMLVQHLGVSYTGSGARLAAAALEQSDEAERLRELSCAVDSQLVVDGLGDQLMPFQQAGVEYVLKRRRVIIADEPGLGKSAQALAALEAESAFPAVVVCPQRLQADWLSAAQRWLPQRRAVAIDGDHAGTGSADLLIVADSALADAVPGLTRNGLRAVVFDQAHRIALNRSGCGPAAVELVGALPFDALRIALTGAAVSDSLEYVIPLLRLIGRLHEFPDAPVGKPLERHLRALCQVRRTRRRVLLQLPVRRRTVVPLAADRRDELLTDALDWIEDFLLTGERMVVFAGGESDAQALLDRFPDCLRVLGPHSEAELRALADRFATPGGPQLCVVHLDALQPGLWLDAAANAAFVELDESPRWREHAEECVHRIGHTRALQAWYLVQARLADVLERAAAA